MNKFKQILPEQMKLEQFQINYYKKNPAETVWGNDKYIVHKRVDVPMFGNDEALITHLSIRRNDNEPCTDWRDFQYIKNELAGEELEGFELYPKESRLVDTANQYHIWVFQNPEMGVPIGWNERLVTDIRDYSKLPISGNQRPFEHGRKPLDHLKNFKKLIKEFKNHNKKEK